MENNKNQFSNKNIFKESEADQWFERNLSFFEKEERGCMLSTNTLISWLIPFKSEINNILEVGCGSGHNLNALCEKLESKGIGIDPSKKAISYAKEKFYKNSSFIVGTADNINLPNHSFDLLHFGFCLYLVDRNDYYKAIAEADSLVKAGGFISIIDFDPWFNTRRNYHHKEGVSSFKTKNSQVFTSTNHYSLVNKISLSHQHPYFSKDPQERVELCLLYKETNAYIDG